MFDNLDPSNNKIGRYANFTPQDQRYDVKLEEWIILFQLDSKFDNDFNIMWSGAGVFTSVVQLGL
ncbi:DUF1963 domain-containing protein [Pseudoalteromonas umbrosa]|uniref:DUF1963 domain-containing protein n=1 Tax=Pseudoalteromonas umbrosa TaxID=3048489 RepID=UPI0034DFBC8C